MEQDKQIEFLLVDTTGENKHAVVAGLAWLAENGGGCVVTPDRRTMENALGTVTDGEFKKAENQLGSYGIALSWKRRGLPYGARNVVALYMDKEIDEIIQRGSTERVFFIPWMESEANWFKNAYRPTIVEIDKNGSIISVNEQPAYANAKDSIPDEQDKILEILARMAAGYGNSLQWRERERFKADLMNNRSAWMAVDPKVVLRRCAELGMSAENADEISNMVKQLKNGHRFRSKRGYEDGWRH